MEAAQINDPIRAEVIRHALIATAEDMKLSLVRTAYNPIIYEAYDFSTGVFDADGRLAAQAAGLPIFLGTLDWAVRAVIDKFGAEAMREGDVYLSNDPYAGGGTHLNDVSVIMPVFCGTRAVGFTASRAHWTDVGGAVPLSVQTDARDIHGEGLMLPVVRLKRQGSLNSDVMDIILANSRPLGRVAGDLGAQLAAGHVGAQRLEQLALRYEPQVLADTIRWLQDQTERRVALRLRALPDFDECAQDALDDDGRGGPPTRVRVRAVKQGAQLKLDFAGSDSANPSGYNCSLCGLVSAVRVIFKALVDPETPPDDGSFRALEVLAPAGSFINALPPTAVSLYGEPGRRAIDAVWRAFARALGDAVPAAHYGTMAGLAMAGWDDRPSRPTQVSYQGPNAGGWGASAGAEGESAMCSITNGDTRNTPSEIIEHTAPLRVVRYALRADSGGAGRTRGGLGLLYEFEVLTGAGFAITCALGRTDISPFGAGGGHPGACTLLEVWRQGELIATLKRATAFPLRRGDRVLLKTGGGGGYGDPGERDPQALAADVARGYVTAQWARENHPSLWERIAALVEADQRRSRV